MIQNEAQGDQENDVSPAERRTSDHELCVRGKKYSVMASPWIESRTLEEFRSAGFAASIGSPNQSSESARRSAARELYNMLPPAERDNMDVDRIADHVSRFSATASIY
jgi:hypothetical protein